MAMLRGEHLVPWQTMAGDKLEILYLGDLSAEVIVDFISLLHCFCSGENLTCSLSVWFSTLS